MKSTKGQRFPIETLTPDEVSRLLAQCSTKAATGARNRALLVTLYRSGLRISEALDLLPRDVDVSAGAIRVRHGKNDKARLVGLDSGAMAIVSLWLTRRAALGLKAQAPVFCTLKGEALATAYIRALLPRLARKAGIEKRCHAHGLRHTHAAELAGENVPINIISRQLGHSNVATTSRYVDHIAAPAVVAAMQARAWSL